MKLCTLASIPQLEPCPVNPYRKMLVCDVLPGVLARISDPQQKNLYRWIQKSIDFCINYITQPHLLHASAASVGDESAGGGIVEAETGVVGSASAPPVDPWGTLFQILDAAGAELGWSASKGIFKLESREAQWTKIFILFQDKILYQDPSGAAYKQLLYVTIVLFLHCVRCVRVSVSVCGASVSSVLSVRQTRLFYQC